MVDHLGSSSNYYLQNERTPLLELSNQPELMELNVEMSCMNISDPSSQSEMVLKSIISSNKDPDENTAENIIKQDGKASQKRTLRKRIRPVDYSKEKIETLPKIQKLNKVGPISQEDIEKYYLCKNTKRLHPALETIYEEPKKPQSKSKRKLKRSIQFDQESILSNKLKIKRRLMRAKQLPSSNNFLNRKKVSMESLLSKLSNLEADTE